MLNLQSQRPASERTGIYRVLDLQGFDPPTTRGGKARFVAFVNGVDTWAHAAGAAAAIGSTVIPGAGLVADLPLLVYGAMKVGVGFALRATTFGNTEALGNDLLASGKKTTIAAMLSGIFGLCGAGPLGAAVHAATAGVSAGNVFRALRRA